MPRASRPTRVAALQARREALLARIDRERRGFTHAVADVAPLLRFGDRIAVLGGTLRAQPLVIGAGYVGRALLRRSRAGRWWRRGRVLSALLSPAIRLLSRRRRDR